MSVGQQTLATQLAEQINDEFLTCKICYEHYKDPKCLTCLHTFCEECIEQHVGAQRSYKYTDYREFSCPICRKKTVIPSGGVRKLADNFLVSNLNELMLSKKPSKIAYCDICKIINQRERDATSKCVECQKLMCSSCVEHHSKTKITSHHSVFELDIEKDIMCKEHPNEQVRFYCEACECCVCVPCTYTEHRDHELVDFKDGIKHHKDKVQGNLYRCRNKIDELRERCDSLRSCETSILCAQNEIHTAALSFVETIRLREKALIEELDEAYGYETTQYLKKKEDFETLLDQLKSTCNLTEMVVKGKDIEMLLLKKQLCDKFDEFDRIEIDTVPRNLLKKIIFVPGIVELGKLKDPDYIEEVEDKTSTPDSDKPFYNAYETTNGNYYGNKNNDSDVENGETNGYGHDHTDSNNNKNSEPTENFTQTTYEELESTEAQTDIQMNQDLHSSSNDDSSVSSLDSKETQTDIEITNSPLAESNRSLSSQSSLDEESAPVDRNKLGRRVRRHVKPGCSIAVLPSSEIIIIDPEANCISILDRRGKFRYGMSNSNKSCNDQGHATNASQFGTAAFGHLPRLDRGVRLLTPQGTLIVKLINESTVATPPPPNLIDSVESTPVSNASDTPVGSRDVSIHDEFTSAPIADKDEEDEDEDNDVNA